MKQPHIVVVGSLNMDLVVSMHRMPIMGETIPGSTFHTISGGKGANQAVGCARLGAKVTLIGAVGKDGFGAQILDGLKAEGILTDKIKQVLNVPTGVANVLHTSEDNCIVIVAGANEQCTPEWVDDYEQLIGKADLLLVQLEIPLASVKRAMQIAHASGVPVVLNPAPAQKLSRDILQYADFITPNEIEFDLLSEGLCDRNVDLQQRMILWNKEYNAELIITRGKEGSSFIRNNSLHTVKAPIVQVVDTTGAGDAFNAGFSVAYASGETMMDSVEFAVKVASTSVTRFGAQAGMPSFEEITNI
ncbi:ribokinase [Paenibacillus sp. HWE-109]|uniref:ribokinase n=1 Tax=Paenibacillus sp. HWE-109 TaxID=1306526 RepID=UPI001EDD14B4|nr:ribokinase [Paenibacillus sp. HWE-109]UKS23867.1 ribokinase [Paenibacillus sp. HWE-109]